jgi:multimeric flavodoxin WrbA
MPLLKNGRGKAMKVTILNGNPDASNTIFDDYLKKLSEILSSESNQVIIFTLRDMDIKYCRGCWGCWVKTPGECLVEDDTREIRCKFIPSDLVLFASPVRMGFTSALLKRAHERLLPLIHPYLELVDGEVHHIARYDKYPLMALLLEKGEDVDEEDIKIISDIYRRDAINFKTSFCFTKSTSDPLEEVANEINGL